ncbi:class I SAM-dependent methyltransferase [Spirosoma harenae]
MAWYHNFFHGLPQEAWKAAQTEEQTQLDLELLVETLEFGPDDRLLDVFCGYGRHALPLARMGAQLTCIDISPDYIAELQNVVKKEKLPLTAISTDFLAVPENKLGGTSSFDAVYCLGNSFSFFPPADMKKFLSRIASLLKPGGRFLAHSEMIAETILPDYQERNWLPVDTADGGKILLLVENEYVPIDGRIDSHLTYIKDGVTQTRLAQHYVYTLSQLCQLFTEVELNIVNCFGTVFGDPYALGDEAVWILAEKPKSHR